MITFLRQLLSDGVVHGDPHVGNMGIHEDGRLVLYDFGSVVRLSREDVCHLKELFTTLIVGDVAAAVVAFRRLGAEVTDEAALQQYVGVYRDYMRTLDFGAMVASATAMALDDEPSAADERESARPGVSGASPASDTPSTPLRAPKLSAAVPAVLPTRISRIVRSFALLEGICKSIDPGFNYFDAIASSPADLDLLLDRDFIAYKVRNDPIELERRALRAMVDLLTTFSLPGKGISFPGPGGGRFPGQ